MKMIIPQKRQAPSLTRARPSTPERNIITPTAVEISSGRSLEKSSLTRASHAVMTELTPSTIYIMLTTMRITSFFETELFLAITISFLRLCRKIFLLYILHQTRTDVKTSEKEKRRRGRLALWRQRKPPPHKNRPRGTNIREDGFSDMRFKHSMLFNIFPFF